MGEAPRRIAIPDLLNEVREQCPKPQRNQIAIEAPAHASITVPEQATLRSMAALVQNALDASEPDRPVRLYASQSGIYVRISVEDQGCGMPEAVLRRIGEPFFTTKEPGKGMGLGTFLVRTFAERVGGRVSFESVAGRGTTVVLELPVNATVRNGYVAV